MALPVIGNYVVFDAIVATTTTELHTLAANPAGNRYAGAILLEVVGSSTPNWTLDIQGKVHASGTYTNIDYIVIENQAAAGLATTQLAVTDTTARFYLIPNPPQFVQLVATRTGGTLTVYASHTSTAFTQWLKTSSRGAVLAEGSEAQDAANNQNPLIIGGQATSSAPAQTAAGDVVRAVFDQRGNLLVGLISGDRGALVRNNTVNGDAIAHTTSDVLEVGAALVGLAPDGSYDRLRTQGDVAPALGALKVALIGGDQNLRASAVMGEASGTSTALADMGWARAFQATLDVTAVPTGGTPTLDVYIQTQLSNGDWQDIAHFTQVAGSTTKQNMTWGPVSGHDAGTQAESAAVTVDNYFAAQDAGLTATTIRLMQLGDSFRVKWVFVVGASTGDYTFGVTSTFRS